MNKPSSGAAAHRAEVAQDRADQREQENLEGAAEDRADEKAAHSHPKPDDASTSKTHKDECGDVGDTGDHGEIGENAK
jgi:hypothetical protein